MRAAPAFELAKAVHDKRYMGKRRRRSAGRGSAVEKERGHRHKAGCRGACGARPRRGPEEGRKEQAARQLRCTARGRAALWPG